MQKQHFFLQLTLEIIRLYLSCFSFDKIQKNKDKNRRFFFLNSVIYLIISLLYPPNIETRGREEQILPSRRRAVCLGSSSWLEPERVWLQTTVSHLAAGGSSRAKPSVSKRIHSINKASQVTVMRGSAQKYTGNYNRPVPVYRTQWTDRFSRCPRRRGHTESSKTDDEKVSFKVTCAKTRRSDQILSI